MPTRMDVENANTLNVQGEPARKKAAIVERGSGTQAEPLIDESSNLSLAE